MCAAQGKGSSSRPFTSEGIAPNEARGPFFVVLRSAEVKES
jgi:hypothetical protein